LSKFQSHRAQELAADCVREASRDRIDLWRAGLSVAQRKGYSVGGMNAWRVGNLISEERRDVKVPNIMRVSPGAHSPHPARQNLSPGVAEQIEEYIRSSGMTVGSKLPGERFLSRSFGISRTVLREAIDILESKGIVETSAARGVFVIDGGFQKTTVALSEHLLREAIPLEEFIDARRFLEGHIATLAARHRTEADLKTLTKNLRTMKAAIGDAESFFKEDIDFHTLLARASGNRLYPVWLEPIIKNLTVMSPHKMLRAVRERIVICHQDILSAVEASNPEAAYQAVARHIDQYEQDVHAFSPAPL